jgi:predicted Zn-dependent peptidase
MPHVERAVINIFLRTGSRYESKEKNGISHFLEHMLFRGTAAHPSAFELARTFEDLGGTLVASTAADHGTLAIAVPRENVVAALEEMSRVIIAPRIEEIELERGIIREELLEDLGENGEMLDGPSLVRQLSFGEHGLAQLITGPLENVERFSIAELREHHALTYVGAHMVLSVAGNVDAEEIEGAVRKHFAALPQGAPLALTSPSDATEAKFQFVRHPGGSQTSLNLAYRGLSDRHRLEPALDLLLRVIDDGMSTRLYHRLCDTRGLCYDAYASYEAYADSGIVEFGTETAHERGPEVLRELLQLIDELRENAPSERELERAKKRASWQTAAMFDSSADVSEFLAMGELCSTAATPATRLSELMSVTSADLFEVANLVFRPERRVCAAVGNPKKDALARLEKLALRAD